MVRHKRFEIGVLNGEERSISGAGSPVIFPMYNYKETSKVRVEHLVESGRLLSVHVVILSTWLLMLWRLRHP